MWGDPTGNGGIWSGSPLLPCPGIRGAKGWEQIRRSRGRPRSSFLAGTQEGPGYQRGRQQLPLGPAGKGERGPGDLGSCSSTCAGSHRFPGLLQPGGLGDTAGPAPCIHPPGAAAVLLDRGQHFPTLPNAPNHSWELPWEEQGVGRPQNVAHSLLGVSNPLGPISIHLAGAIPSGTTQNLDQGVMAMN